MDQNDSVRTLMEHNIYHQTPGNAASSLHTAVFLHGTNPAELLSLAEQKSQQKQQDMWNKTTNEYIFKLYCRKKQVPKQILRCSRAQDCFARAH